MLLDERVRLGAFAFAVEDGDGLLERVRIVGEAARELAHRAAVARGRQPSCP